MLLDWSLHLEEDTRLLRAFHNFLGWFFVVIDYFHIIIRVGFAVFVHYLATIVQAFILISLILVLPKLAQKFISVLDQVKDFTRQAYPGFCSLFELNFLKWCKSVQNRHAFGYEFGPCLIHVHFSLSSHFTFSTSCTNLSLL